MRSTEALLRALTVPPETLVISEGADAWKRIKDRARMDRDDWKLVGEALLIGRRLHPGKKNDRAFGQWCREHGFGDMHRNTRTDAMWLAENWDAVWACALAECTSDLSNPQHIRQAYREATKPSPAPTSVPFTQADADYAMKLHRMAEGRANENESAVAQAKLEKLAADHGMTGEEIVEKSRVTLGLNEEFKTKEEVMSPLDEAYDRYIQPYRKWPKEKLLELLLVIVKKHPEIMDLIDEVTK